MRTTATVLLLALLTSGLGWSQQEKNHWQDYQPRTLQSIIEMHREDIADLDRTAKDKAMLLTCDNFPSQTVLYYKGKSRPLPADKEKLLQAWREMLKGQGSPPDEFQTEVLFREGRQNCWIALQKSLLDALSKEVKSGETLRAYVVWVGAIRAGKQWRWLFAMNGFTPSQPDEPEPLKP